MPTTMSEVEHLLAESASQVTPDRVEYELVELEEPLFRELDWAEWAVRIREHWHTCGPQRDRGVTVTHHYFRSEQEALAAYPEAKVIV